MTTTPEQIAFRKLDNPWVCPGCYCLDLYCDHENADHDYDEFPHGFTAECGATCRKEARANGWKLHRDGTATCPKCVNKDQSNDQ